MGHRALLLPALCVLGLVPGLSRPPLAGWAAESEQSSASDRADRPAAAASFAPIVNDRVRRTTSGAVVRANAGSVLRVGQLFYWYGMEYDGTVTDRLFTGTIKVNLYTSPDLSSWRFVTSLITYDSSRTSDVPPAVWLGRPDITYSAATGQYVLSLVRNVGFRNDLAFYTASSPTGPFTRRVDKEVVLVDGLHTMGDKGEFQDADGTAYLLFVSDVTGFNSNTGVARLTPDHLGIVRVLSSCGGRHKEALTVVGHDAAYYLFASETTGWLSSSTWYKRASSMDGFRCTGGQDGFGWERVRTDPGTPDSFNTQHGNVVAVQGRSGTALVEIGDRWSQFDARVGGIGSTAWYPLTFDATGAPVLHGRARWSIDVTAGRWH